MPPVCPANLPGIPGQFAQNRGPPTIFTAKSHKPVTVGRTRKKSNKWNFYGTHTIYKCGRWARVGVPLSKSFVIVSHWTCYLRSMHIRVQVKSSRFVHFTTNNSIISLPRHLLYADALVYTMSSKIFCCFHSLRAPSLHSDFSKLSAVIRVTFCLG